MFVNVHVNTSNIIICGVVQPITINQQQRGGYIMADIAAGLIAKTVASLFPIINSHYALCSVTLDMTG